MFHNNTELIKIKLTFKKEKFSQSYDNIKLLKILF